MARLARISGFWLSAHLLAQLEDAGGALSELALAQSACTAHPSSRVFHVLSQQMSRLANCSFSARNDLADQ